jgi:hypothetical protein
VPKLAYTRLIVRLAVVGAALAALLTLARAGGTSVGPTYRELLGVGLSVFLPGLAVAGALRLDERIDELLAFALVPALGVLAWAPPLAVALTLKLPFGFAAGVVVAVTWIAAAVRLPRPPPWQDLAALAGLGALAAFLGARWQSILIGDGLFHASVIRKLLTVNGISWTNVWPFYDQHSHAGYAVPLLHGAQAGAVMAAGGSFSTDYTFMVPAFSVFVPLAAYALGSVILGRPAAIVSGLLAIWMAITAEQSLSVAQQPRYYVSLIIVPLVWAVLLAARPGRATTGTVIGLLLLVAFVHSTYELPVLITGGTIAVLRPAMRRPLALGAAASAAVIGAVYAITILGAPKSPPPYRPNSEFQIFDGHRVAVSGSVIFHGRPELVLALLAIIVFLGRRGTALGWLAAAGAVEYLLVSVPGVLWPVMAVVGEGQGERYWEEIPWVWMLAPAIVLAARAAPLRTALAAALGTYVLERTHFLPGSHATYLAWAGALVVVYAGLRAVQRRRWPTRPARVVRQPGWVAVGLVTIGVMFGSLHKNDTPVSLAIRHGRIQPGVTDRPTPAAVDFLETGDRRLSVVLAPYHANHANWFAGMSYELVGEAGVYTVAMSHYHTQADPKDQPNQRRADVDSFLRPATSSARRNAILARWRVQFVVVEQTAPAALRRQLDADPQLRRVFADPPSVPGYASLIIWQVRRSS